MPLTKRITMSVKQSFIKVIDVKIEDLALKINFDKIHLDLTYNLVFSMLSRDELTDNLVFRMLSRDEQA